LFTALGEGVNFDGSLIRDFVRIEESDIKLAPDSTLLSSLSGKRIPWLGLFVMFNRQMVVLLRYILGLITTFYMSKLFMKYQPYL